MSAACPPQHLDLSNCCLTRVPPVLASLPRLTCLTLNENDALGASPAALAPLSTLTNLQVRQWCRGGQQQPACGHTYCITDSCSWATARPACWQRRGS